MKEITKQILNYFEQGYTMIEVSKKLEINYKAVESVKRRYNIIVRKMEQSKANHYYIDNIDNFFTLHKNCKKWKIDLLFFTK